MNVRLLGLGRGLIRRMSGDNWYVVMIFSPKRTWNGPKSPQKRNKNLTTHFDQRPPKQESAKQTRLGPKRKKCNVRNLASWVSQQNIELNSSRLLYGNLFLSFCFLVWQHAPLLNAVFPLVMFQTAKEWGTLTCSLKQTLEGARSLQFWSDSKTWRASWNISQIPWIFFFHMPVWKRVL